MYLSKELILSAFNGLKKIFPQDGGKSRLERVSGLRIYLAAARVINASSNDQINLKSDSKQRKDLIEAVGEVVRLNDKGRYTKDFSTQTRVEPDYMVGSNVLTTRVAASRNTESVYPKRPKPVLTLNDEIATISPDAEINLKSAYNLNLINTELQIWLVRFESLPVNENSTAQEIAAIIRDKIRALYGQSVATLLAKPDTDLEDILASHSELLVSNHAADLSELWRKKSTQGNDNNDTKIIVMAQDDPYLNEIRDAIDRKGEKNFLFFGTPGTGKTWHASQIAEYLSAGESNRVKFLQFHPSVSYDDFVEGFVPRIDKDIKAVVYDIQQKHFIRFAKTATDDPDNDYFMIIDEISRGDPARVFGELLTYIEPNYRTKEFSLIYSGEPFSVPENLVIFATANPYDRSVGELDDAFLRRFYMLKFEPNSDLLKQRLLDNNLASSDIQKIVHFFEVINENLPFGFGHAQLFNVFTTDDMKVLWKSKLEFITQRALQFEQEKFDNIHSKFSELFENNVDDEGKNPTNGINVQSTEE